MSHSDREPESWEQQAHDLCDSGSYPEALTAINEAIDGYLHLADTNQTEWAVTLLKTLLSPMRGRALIHLILGDLEEAIKDFEDVIMRCRILIESGETEWAGDLVEALTELASAMILLPNSDKEAARTVFMEAIAGSYRLIGSDPMQWIGNLVCALNGYARTLIFLGDLEEALTAFESAINFSRILIGQGQTMGAEYLFGSLEGRAQTLFVLGDLETARTAYKEAITSFRELIDAGQTQWTNTLMPTFLAEGLARTLHLLGDKEAARAAFNESIGDYHKFVDGNQTQGAFNQIVSRLVPQAQILESRVCALYFLGDREAQRTTHEEVIAGYHKLIDAGQTQWDGNLIRALALRAWTLSDQEALAAFEEAITGYRELIDAGQIHWAGDLARALEGRAWKLHSLNDQEATLAFEEAIAGFRELIAAGQPQWGGSLLNVTEGRALALFSHGDRDAAQAALQEAIDGYRKLIDAGQTQWGKDLFGALTGRAYMLATDECWDAVLEDLRAAFEAAVEHNLVINPDRLAVMSSLFARCLAQPELGSWAVTFYLQSLTLLESYLDSFQRLVTKDGEAQESALREFWGQWIAVFVGMQRYVHVLDVVARAHGRHTAAQAMAALLLDMASLDEDQHRYVELDGALHEVERQLASFSSDGEAGADASRRGVGVSGNLGGTERRYQALVSERQSRLEERRREKTTLIAAGKLPEALAATSISRESLNPAAGEPIAVWVTPEEFGLSILPFVLLVSQPGVVQPFFDGQDGPRPDFSKAYKLERQLTKELLRGRCVRDAGNTTFTGSFASNLKGNAPHIGAPDVQLRSFLAEMVWTPLINSCRGLGAKTLHMVTAGRLHTLPWQGSAPKQGLALHLHPGVFAYVKHRNANVQDTPLPSPQKKLLVLAYDAADELERRLYCIPLEIACLQTIWGDDAVRVVDDVPADKSVYAGLACLGHGGFNDETDQAGLYLGQGPDDKPRYFHEALLSADGNHYPHLEASACVLGRVTDRRNEPCGLIATALTKPKVRMAMGALLPVDDLLTTLRTLLVHSLWKWHQLSPREAAIKAMDCMESGDWPPEAIESLRLALIRALPKMAKAMEQDGHKLIAQKIDITRIDQLRLDLTLDGSTQAQDAKRHWKRLVYAMGESQPFDQIVQELSTLIGKSLPRVVAQRNDLRAFTRYWMVC